MSKTVRQLSYVGLCVLIFSRTERTLVAVNGGVFGGCYPTKTPPFTLWEGPQAGNTAQIVHAPLVAP